MDSGSKPRMGMFQIGFIVFLVFLVIGAALTLFFSYQYGRKLTNNTTTKGMSGLAGTTINMQCPAGQVISFTNNNTYTTCGALVCSGNPQCDGFAGGNQLANFFNPTTTIDVMNDTSFTDLQGCAGKQQCNWNVPVASTNPVNSDPRLAGKCLSTCAGTNGQLQFIGTYDCVSA